MALARVVEFDGVGKERLEEMRQQMEGEAPPEGVPVKEIIVLHDADAEKAVAVLFFDSEEDYRQGNEALNAMPTEDTLGKRSLVKKYDASIARRSEPTTMELALRRLRATLAVACSAAEVSPSGGVGWRLRSSAGRMSSLGWTRSSGAQSKGQPRSSSRASRASASRRSGSPPSRRARRGRARALVAAGRG